MLNFCATILAVLLPLSAHAGPPDYTKITPTCKDCTLINNVLNKFSLADPDGKRDLALKAAELIHHVTLKDKSTEDQRREIYFSLKACVEVFDDDFDSETVVGLMELRAAAPKDFDYVFQRFPLKNQNAIVERMKGFKEDGIGPKVALPAPKAIDP